MIVRYSLKNVKICIGKNIFHPGNVPTMAHFDTPPADTLVKPADFEDPSKTDILADFEDRSKSATLVKPADLRGPQRPIY